MNFTKNKGMSIVAVFIILAVFNVVAFVLPFNRTEMFWTGYAFSMAAILLTAGVGFYAFKREGLRSKFYGMPLLLLAWIYLIVQLIVGMLSMVLSFIPFEYGVVLNVVLLGVCLVGLIATDIGKGEIERVDKKLKEVTFTMKSLQADVEGLLSRVTDETAKKALKDLAEAIRFSDPMSTPQLAAIENKIEAKVSALADSIANIDMIKTLCDELQQLIADRNRKCKMMK